jgi:hypothetical protein
VKLLGFWNFRTVPPAFTTNPCLLYTAPTSHYFTAALKLVVLATWQLTRLACCTVSGGGTARYQGKWFWNQACCLISGTVIRFMGSTSSILGIRSLAPSDKWLGNV